MKTRENLFYKSVYKYLLSCFLFQLQYLKQWNIKLVFKICFKESNQKTKASTGMSRDILPTFKLNQTFVIDINIIDYL